MFPILLEPIEFEPLKPIEFEPLEPVEFDLIQVDFEPLFYEILESVDTDKIFDMLLQARKTIS